MKLAIELDEDRITAGQEVSGRVRVLEGGASRTLTLTLSFREESPSYLETPFSEGSVIHEGDLATGAALEFQFTQDRGTLPCAKGRHGALYWELEAVSDEPGLDTRVSRVLDVVTPPR